MQQCNVNPILFLFRLDILVTDKFLGVDSSIASYVYTTYMLLAKCKLQGSASTIGSGQHIKHLRETFLNPLNKELYSIIACIFDNCQSCCCNKVVKLCWPLSNSKNCYYKIKNKELGYDINQCCLEPSWKFENFWIVEGLGFGRKCEVRNGSVFPYFGLFSAYLRLN